MKLKWKFFKLLIFIFLLVGIAYFFRANVGYILITYHHYAFQTSLAFALLSIIALSLVIIFILKILRLPYRMINAWRRWQEKNREKTRAQQTALAAQKASWLSQLGIASQKDLPTLRTIWATIPKKMRDKSLLAIYWRGLNQFQMGAEVEKPLRQFLFKQFDPTLVRLYGELQNVPIEPLLKYTERLLKLHPKDTVLLLTLGRLTMRRELWGQARRYLEESLAAHPLPETYYELAKLSEKLNQPAEADQYYRKGLTLAAA